jgi:hypothetical protein
MKKKGDSPKVTFKYEISPNYTMYAISGVHGGLNAQGNVIMNLFSERFAIPKEETFEVSEKDGSLGKEPAKTDKLDAIIRDVLLGISITPPTARAIAGWLNEKADQHDNLIKQAKEKAEK